MHCYDVHCHEYMKLFVQWKWNGCWNSSHYNDVIMCTIASQISSLIIVYSIVYSDADQRKHQSSALLPFVRGIPILFIIPWCYREINAEHSHSVDMFLKKFKWEFFSSLYDIKMMGFSSDKSQRIASFLHWNRNIVVRLPQCQRSNPDEYG